MNIIVARHLIKNNEIYNKNIDNISYKIKSIFLLYENKYKR